MVNSVHMDCERRHFVYFGMVCSVECKRRHVVSYLVYHGSIKIDYSTTDYIEMRICGDEPTSDKDCQVAYYELYVK